LNLEIRRAAEILRAGGLVAFPTETVYGLGADASNAAAVARLYAAKGRPEAHPVIVHFADADRAFEWAREVPEAARQLAARFWPGPLTLILKRSAKAGDFVTGGQDSVGLRVPSHPVAQQLLREFGGGVAAPSANLFGNVSPTSAAHVREDLGRQVDLLLEGGSSEVGIESTILDLSGGSPVLLRPGFISKADIEEALHSRISEKSADSPRHSGGLERHYAPKTPALLVPPHALDAEIAKRGTAVAVLAFSRPDERVDYWIRMPREPQAYAQRLYAALRELDGAACETILIEMPPETAEWTAVRDRLWRAAAPVAQ
jgi:L-threonylcarbamoyladenylate synthase